MYKRTGIKEIARIYLTIHAIAKVKVIEELYSIINRVSPPMIEELLKSIDTTTSFDENKLPRRLYITFHKTLYKILEIYHISVDNGYNQELIFRLEAIAFTDNNNPLWEMGYEFLSDLCLYLRQINPDIKYKITDAYRKIDRGVTEYNYPKFDNETNIKRIHLIKIEHYPDI